ncbi:hypothetical protein J6590_101431 [Homalodisca vitripennis]|nr:hypothetical protein J6590_101431 [Homalodisca vitripennis]
MAQALRRPASAISTRALFIAEFLPGSVLYYSHLSRTKRSSPGSSAPVCGDDGGAGSRAATGPHYGVRVPGGPDWPTREQTTREDFEE